MWRGTEPLCSCNNGPLMTAFCPGWPLGCTLGRRRGRGLPGSRLWAAPHSRAPGCRPHAAALAPGRSGPHWWFTAAQQTLSGQLLGMELRWTNQNNWSSAPVAARQPPGSPRTCPGTAPSPGSSGANQALVFFKSSPSALLAAGMRCAQPPARHAGPVLRGLI